MFDKIKNFNKFYIVMLIVITLLAVSFISWQLKQGSELNVLIIDKTVPTDDYREHKGLTWLLNQQKYYPKDSNYYDYRTDYVGVSPGENGNYDILPWPEDVEEFDVIYFADTYGIYEEDFVREEAGEYRSEKLYGGLLTEEVDRVKPALWNGATLVAEFNTFASPTTMQARDDITSLLGVKWEGWIGRFFHDLTEEGEVPAWVVKEYENQHQKKWNYQGAGILLINDNENIEVLEEGVDLNNASVLFYFTDKGQIFFGQGDKGIYYNYWFDIIEEKENSETLAEYKLDLTLEGKERMQALGLPEVFSAVVRNDTGIYTSYYFAGDYVDVPETPKLHNMRWYEKFKEIASINSNTNHEAFYWKSYVPMMKVVLKEALEETSHFAAHEEESIYYNDDGVNLLSRIKEKRLQVYKKDSWQDMVVMGVNMGMAKPGRWFTDFPGSEEPYMRWFNMIGEMNANSVRIYTLQDPAFYRALYKYNRQNPEEPLWLFQEIWPEEHPPENDLLKKEYVDDFLKEIRYVIDAIHGNALIEERRGRAWGNYHVDVSPYTVAYLVGREIEPEEVITTDKNSPEYTFSGNYLEVLEGTATEAWLAKSCDYVLTYEEENYARQTPVAIVSWPTLDAMNHDYALDEEGEIFQDYNDLVTVDIRNITTNKHLKAGFFGAYHIYPNYPDYINNKPEYASYEDEEGVFRYGGYLQDFMEHHGDYAALVAEFGLATGMGNAHSSPDGYHHGGMTEKEQGEGTIRMMETILEEGYMGGIVFEWMDEWAKKTWTTEPFMVPYEHNVFWHNAVDPEQNYGILANEPIRPSLEEAYVLEAFSGGNIVHSLAMMGNEAFFYIDVEVRDSFDFKEHSILIGIDTYDRDKGQFSINSDLNQQVPSGLEFLLKLNSKDDAQLLVTPDYNISDFNFYSQPRYDGVFTEIRPLINREYTLIDGGKIPAIYEEASNLSYGTDTGSTNHWRLEEEVIKIRLPWARLNVTDPFSKRVLKDPGSYHTYPGRDEFQTVETEGFVLYLVVIDKNSGDVIQTLFQDPQNPYLWPDWNQPVYRERLKESYYILQDYFNSKQVP